MKLLLYYVGLSVLQSDLSANIISNDEINLIVDIIRSYEKPTSIALNVCWKLKLCELIYLSNYYVIIVARKRDFISMLQETPKLVQFIDNIDDLKETSVKNDLLIVIDTCCFKSIELLKEANALKMFSAPYRWLVFTNTECSLQSASNISEYSLLIDSEIVLIQQKGHGYILIMPYRIRAETRKVIWENFGTWTPENGLNIYNKMIQPISTRRKNLFGIPIPTSFVITDNSTKTELNSLKNNHIDTLSKTGYRQMNHLYHFMNATNVNVYTDTWGYLINGTWTGMIGSLVRGEAELTGTISFLTAQRLQVLDFLSYPSPPTAKFVFREPSLSYQNNLFLLPFKPTVWFCILGLVFILAVVIFVNAKWEKEKVLTEMPGDTVLRPNASDIAIMIIGAISQQGSSTELKGTLGRLVTFILFIAFVFLYTSYSANIIVLLQSTSNQIRTLTDLYNSKLDLGSEDTPYNRYLFSTATEPIRMAIYQNKIAPRGSKPNFMSLEEGVKKLQMEPFAFNMNLGTGYKSIEKYFYEHEKCSLQEIEYIQENKPWIACRKHSPYKEIYKTGLLRTQEHGLNDRENRLVYAKKPICSVQGGSFMSVNMTDFYPVLLMLLYGIILSFTLLLLEIFHNQRSRLPRIINHEISTRYDDTLCI